mgnify:CR=1 FL=1
MTQRSATERTQALLSPALLHLSSASVPSLDVQRGVSFEGVHVRQRPPPGCGRRSRHGGGGGGQEEGQDEKEEKEQKEAQARREAIERQELAITLAGTFFLLTASAIGATAYLHHMKWLNVWDYLPW